MSTLRALIMVAVVGFSRACSGINIVAEDGSHHCRQRPKLSPHVSPVGALDDQYVSAKNCFTAYCRSDTIRQFLVDACTSRGFASCDDLSYKDTYLYDLTTLQYTYSFTGDIDYDEGHARTTPSSRISWNMKYENGGTEVDTVAIDHKVGRSSTSSWTSTREFKFEEDISLSVSASIPGVVQAKTDITTKFSFDLKTSQSHSETIDQSYEVTDSVNVAPHSCDRVCINENDEDTVVPYTLRGNFTPSGILSDDGGYVCCYTRPGGSDDCSWGGHGGVGWYAWDSPGAAAAWGTAQAQNQCPHITESGGISAHIDLPGSWAGGMKISHVVKKIETPLGQCATCPDPSVNWTAPALTAPVV